MWNSDRGFILLDTVLGLLLTTLLIVPGVLLLQETLRLHRQLVVKERLLHETESTLLALADWMAHAVPGSIRLQAADALTFIPAIGGGYLEMPGVANEHDAGASITTTQATFTIPAGLHWQVDFMDQMTTRLHTSVSQCAPGRLCALLQAPPTQPNEQQSWNDRMRPVSALQASSITLSVPSSTLPPHDPDWDTTLPRRFWLFLEAITLSCSTADNSAGSLQMLPRTNGLLVGPDWPDPDGYLRIGTLTTLLKTCHFELIEVGGTGEHLLAVTFTLHHAGHTLTVARQLRLPDDS